MVLFAGPVFPEWYWGPVVFALLFGPPLLVAGFVAWRFGGRKLAAGVVVGGVLLILGGRALIADVRFDREATAAADAFDFTPYAPSPLPRPFREQRVSADDNWGGPALITTYAAGPDASAIAYQQKPGPEVSLQDGHCSVHDLAGSGTSFFDGPCRALGAGVFVGASPAVVGGGEAFSLLDGTLVRMQLTRVADRDVLAYYDSLRPVSKDDLQFKRGSGR
jgi:hypothetical protein